MKFDERYCPDLAAPPPMDISRMHLRYAYLDKRRGRLIVADGYIAVDVPVTVERGDVSGPIPIEAVIEARKAAAGGTVHIRAGASVKAAGKSFSRQRPKGMVRYPDSAARKVVPGYRHGTTDTVSVCFDAQYLHDLAEALGAEHCHVVLTFPRTAGPMLDPITVVAGDQVGLSRGAAVGVLMPVLMRGALKGKAKG